MKQSIKRTLQWVGIFALGTILAACGGSSSSSSSSSSDAAAAGSSVSSSSSSSSSSGGATGAAGLVSLSAASYAVMQSAASVTVNVQRSQGSAGAISVNYATADGSAVAGTDYTAASGSLTWASGDTQAKSVSIPISDATLWSGTKNFHVTLSGIAGGASTGTPVDGMVNITGSGTPGTLQLSAATYSVAQNGGALVVSVLRAAGTSGAIDVSYATTDGTATAGADYTAASGTLEWQAGDDGAKTFSVPVSNTAPFSGSRTFMIALSAATGSATLGTPSSATATINGGAVASPGTLTLSASAYTVAQSAGALLVTVNRQGGGDGAVSVAYATADGTAKAGTDYTTTKGTLRWSAGVTTAQTFSVPVSSATALTADKSFGLTLSGVTGGALLGTSSATATISAPGSNRPAVRVQGNHLVDVNGATLQMRGVDVSGLEFAPIDGIPQPDGWGGQKPDLSAIAKWKANTLRIPLNEASYLGYTCFDPPNGTAHNPDPMGNYKQLVKQIVDDATALGWYVILDLHKNAPNGMVGGKLQPIAPESATQNEMADTDHSLAFWTAIAGDFKGYPNVVFDLFNEPHIDDFRAPGNARGGNASWLILRDGGTGTTFYGANTLFTQDWTSAGMQAMLNAVRAAGATNVIMVSGISWAQDNSQWVQYAPTDPLKQLAMSWHAYPKYGAQFGSADYNNPGFTQGYDWAQAVLDGGYPIIIGETGDHSAAGTATAPFLGQLLPWADQRNVSVIAWSWNAWGAADDDLIKDASGTPTDGQGVAFHTWMVNHK